MNTTFKSVSASIGLHLLFVLLGSWVFYTNTLETLELTGNGGGGNRSISLTAIHFTEYKKAMQPPKLASSQSRNVKKFIEKNSHTQASDSVSITSASVNSSEVGSQQGAIGSATNGSEQGRGDGPGVGVGDFDHGHLFGQIKKFFESRLGSALNIRENQMIKIKVTLNQEGEILDAILIQGKLEMSVLRRVISAAKNIPLKSYWKAKIYPHELIIPLILTPS